MYTSESKLEWRKIIMARDWRVFALLCCTEKMCFSRLRGESSPPPLEEEIRMNSDESRENRAEFESENERHFR